MPNIDSIANKFRISYVLFAVLLCLTFISIFLYAEMRIERELVKGRLLQQLEQQLSQKGHRDQPIYMTDLGIKIYCYENAPDHLKIDATDKIQEMSVHVDNKTKQTKADLYFFTYRQAGKDYILTYLENPKVEMKNYPVLAIFESLEAIFSDALIIATVLSLLIAVLFSHLSAKQIIKPLLDLKQTVESDHLSLTELTHLPSEVGVLARAIDEKNLKLEQYLKREQLFTGDVSHELRTPLTIIMGASEVLASQLKDDHRLSEFTNRISNTAKETSEIITALLLLSRAPEKLDAPQTSINAIALSEMERLTYLLRHKAVSCTMSADRSYTTNVRPELLKMALGNLIKNAFQYTDEGTVHILIDDQKITVADTGIGIPEVIMPLLYERFERLNHETIGKQEAQLSGIETDAQYKVEGTGLGLSIVQRIMSHMDWQLTHHANASGGSTFSIYYT